MRVVLTVLGWIALLFVGACLDEWMVWRRNRCVRRAKERQ